VTDTRLMGCLIVPPHLFPQYVNGHAAPNAKGERPPPTGTVERTRGHQIFAQRRAEKRGGGSSPPAC
jgi:hypothetical protein